MNRPFTPAGVTVPPVNVAVPSVGCMPSATTSTADSTVASVTLPGMTNGVASDKAPRDAAANSGRSAVESAKNG